MEPVVATAGNQRQLTPSQEPQKQTKTVAVGCERLPSEVHGKQGGVCRGLPPWREVLPAREEVDLLKTPSPANPKAHRT
jgi:hypothetical protein